ISAEFRSAIDLASVDKFRAPKQPWHDSGFNDDWQRHPILSGSSNAVARALQFKLPQPRETEPERQPAEEHGESCKTENGADDFEPGGGVDRRPGRGEGEEHNG